MQELEHFRKKLLALKAEVSQRLDAINTDVRHKVSADLEDQAIENENNEVLNSLGDTSEQELAMINAALQRIEHGDYFTCLECGGVIEESRLELLPYSPYCVKCAHKLEQV